MKTVYEISYLEGVKKTKKQINVPDLKGQITKLAKRVQDIDPEALFWKLDKYPSILAIPLLIISLLYFGGHLAAYLMR